MLLGFHLVDEGENWFHEFIVSSLSNIHQNALQGGGALSWPNYVDVPYRTHEDIVRKGKIGEQLDEYERRFMSLPEPEKNQVSLALSQQNNLEELLDCQCDCEELENLPPTIHETIKDMFKYFFGLLTVIGTRDTHYCKVHSSLPQSICPFCGFHKLEVPGSARPDYDHYLPRSKYPYAAANLYNLVPICDFCNSRYKGEKDPLKGQGGVRRKAFYPYHDIEVTLSLTNGEVLPQNEQEPNWEIMFFPQSDEVETWIDIFEVTTRYKKSVFSECYQDWLEQFSVYAEYSQEDGKDKDVIISRYIAMLERFGFQDDSFFKLAYFKTLFDRYHAGELRYVKFVDNFFN